MPKSVFCLDLTGFFCVAFEDQYVKTNKNTVVLSAAKLYPRNSSF